MNCPWLNKVSFIPGGGGGEKKGLGPRNDVLTTCKALILVSGVFVLTLLNLTAGLFSGVFES